MPSCKLNPMDPSLLPAPPAVVLAAGDGSRLGTHTLHLPKPLVPLGGRPIVDYTLDSLARAGINRALVVTGYRAGQVRSALAGPAHGLALTFSYNPAFHLGAAGSLATARDYTAGKPFLLVMSDHVLGTDLVSALLAAAGDTTAVGADFLRQRSHTSTYIAEATKLRVGPGGQVSAIGKGIEPWDALDTGAFYCTPAIWAALDACEPEAELSDVFTELARRQQLVATDVSGCFWYDIDTDADLHAAGELIGASHGL